MTWSELVVSLRELNTLSIVVRMLFAILAGGVIGMERERKRRPAGFRTHMLVCLGSALVMMINQYIFYTFTQSSDPARLGAQVISGIGFLGAGTILITSRQQVRGLTTAAGLWASACMGLAIGIGFYEGALIACVCIFLTITLLDRLNDRIVASSRHLTLYIEFGQTDDYGAFIDRLREQEIKVSDLEISKARTTDEHRMLIVIASLESRHKLPHSDIISMIAGLDGVRKVEEL
jgi:putative Mg2+ transporter-C (MgtC) family protein